MLNGTNGEVNVVHIDAFGNVFIGGSFTMAGSVKTGPIAVWKQQGSGWEAVSGASSDDFANGAVVNAIETDCVNLPDSVKEYPCDVFIGGVFDFNKGGSIVGQNLAKYDYSGKTWVGFAKTEHGASDVTAISKFELAVVSSAKKVYVGGNFGNSVYFKIYDISAKTWTAASNGPTGPVRDIYYNANLFSTDNIIVAADSFPAPCSGVCNYDHKKDSWTQIGTGIKRCCFHDGNDFVCCCILVLSKLEFYSIVFTTLNSMSDAISKRFIRVLLLNGLTLAMPANNFTLVFTLITKVNDSLFIPTVFI